MAEDFEALAARLSAELRTFASDALRALCYELAAQLKRNTPVLTGFHRASWIPWAGGPPASAPEDLQAAIAAGSAGLKDVAEYELGRGKLGVSNGGPAIVRLANGWSKQQAAGWVERSIEVAIATTEALFSGRLSTKLSVARARAEAEATGPERPRAPDLRPRDSRGRFLGSGARP